MKICVITATYPMEDFGGIFVKEQCEQLAANGNEICVLYCSGQQKAIRDLKIHEENFNGVRVLYNCFPRFAITYAPHFWCKYLSLQLEQLYQKMLEIVGKPDVFYAHFSFPAGKIATALGQREKIPVVIAEHWSGLINGKAKGAVLSIIRESLIAANSIICVSPALRESVNRIIDDQEKITVIPNMLSSVFEYHPRKEKEKFIFFSMGTLNEKKQFDLLIRAFIEAFKSDEQIELRIGGSGPDERTLKHLIEDSGRSRQIQMLGQLERDETLAEYSMSDAFILLSPKETFGIVFREAMAVGRPIISLDNGGIRYNWKSDYGIIVESKSDELVSEVAKAMRNMVESIDDYNLKKISEDTLAVFSAADVSKNIEDVLQKSKDSFRV